MPTPILATKLYIPPRRPNLVARPRLLARMDAGAHGKLSDMAEGAIYRLWKRKNPRDFLNYAGQDTNLGGLNRLSEAELPLEFMLNALRLSDGWPLQLFQQRTGLGLDAIQTALQEAQERGLLRLTADRAGVTELGQRFLNDALQLFMPEQDLSDA